MMISRLGSPLRRPWQFHLRTLLVLMTLAALASSIYAWRQRREDYLVHQVENFNDAMDRQEFEEAETITLEATKNYPDEPILAIMLEKCRLAQRISEGREITIEGCFQCW